MARGTVKKLLIGMGIAGVAFLAAAGSSSAAPPQLLSVGQTGGHLTATWSLPPAFRRNGSRLRLTQPF